MPPAEPIDSPILEAFKNLAWEVLDKSVAFLFTDNIPINIPTLKKFGNGTKLSVWAPAIASVKLE